MKTCEDYEIDLERRAAGRLGPEDARGLAAHLEGCAACRGYARGLERMARIARAANDRVASPARRQRVSKYALRREARQQRRLRRYYPWMLFFGLFSFVGLLDGPPLSRLFWGGFLLALSFQPVEQILRQRRLLRMAESPEDLLELSRGELASRRHLVWTGVWLALVFGLLAIASGLGTQPPWLEPLELHSPPAVGWGLGLALVAAAIYLVAHVVPALRREAAQYE